MEIQLRLLCCYGLTNIFTEVEIKKFYKYLYETACSVPEHWTVSEGDSSGKIGQPEELYCFHSNINCNDQLSCHSMDWFGSIALNNRFQRHQKTASTLLCTQMVIRDSLITFLGWRNGKTASRAASPITPSLQLDLTTELSSAKQSPVTKKVNTA